MAGSAQHHQGDGPASSPGRVRMGRAVCGDDLVGGLLDDLVLEFEVVVWSRWFRVGLRINIDGVSVGYRIAPWAKSREQW